MRLRSLREPGAGIRECRPMPEAPGSAGCAGDGLPEAPGSAGCAGDGLPEAPGSAGCAGDGMPEAPGSAGCAGDGLPEAPGSAGCAGDGLRSSAIAHLYEMLHGVDQAADGGVVLTFAGAADLAETQRSQRLLLATTPTVRRLDLGDDQARHQAVASSAAGASSSPSTALTVRPRSCATCWGLRSDCRAATVAFTRLIGFWLPSDFESTSLMPASSSTARTPPPAITPVPGDAGLSKTRDAECRPITS